MKKFKILFFVVLTAALTAIISLGTSAHALTLQEIADSYNGCYYLVRSGSDVTVTVEQENKLVVTDNANNFSYEYTLDGNILVGYFGEEMSEDNVIDSEMYSIYLTDIVETLLGYDEGEYLNCLFSNDIFSFNVADNGIEIVEGDNSFEIKIDISRKADAIDFSETYGTVDKFTAIEDILRNGFITNVFGNVWFCKYDNEDKCYIYVGELRELSQLGYETLRCAIEVMFGEDAAADFVSNCPDFTESRIYGNSSLTVDPEIDSRLTSFLPTNHEFVLFVTDCCTSEDYEAEETYETEAESETEPETVAVDEETEEITEEIPENKEYTEDDTPEDTSMILPAAAIVLAAIVIAVIAAAANSKRRKRK